MEASFDGACVALAESDSFGQVQFGASAFGDKRLTRRAVHTADALLRFPAGTLPAKLNRVDLLGYYDFANNKKVTHQNTLAAPRQRTRQLMEETKGVVLIIHDTTEADYSGLDVADLGPIGNGGRHGLLLHNVLAVDYQQQEVLGLVGQFVHKRRRVGKKESARATREHPQRESRLWLKGVDAVGEVPAGALWVNLMDRGGDTFESIQKQVDLHQSFIVRSKSNRRSVVAGQDGRRLCRKLHHWAAKLPRLGERMVSVSANQEQPAREAKVAVGAGAVRLLAPPRPHCGEYRREPVDVWVVHAREVDPPPGVESLQWFLLTNVPTETRQQAWERLDWYGRRPIIEEFHKAQKTGCGMELLQFTTRKAIEVSIAILSVVAVQLLRLRDLSRRSDAEVRPASEVVSVEMVEVLSLWRFKEVRDLSVKEFLYGLARLGGHLGRHGDRPPGWLVLWRGWMELQRLVEGDRLRRHKTYG